MSHESQLAANLRLLRQVQDATQALAEIYDNEALVLARQQDESSDPGPLAGLAMVLKDNILHQGHVCTAGSRLLADYRATYTAHAVERLQAAGAIVVARSHMDEFGMGSTTEHCAWGLVRNPHNPDYVPGGSSGGSAAVVGGGALTLALGSDTGGSIRQPAAWCGAVGLKPTWGRVSRRGLIAFASSMDQIGPITQTVEQAAVALRHMAGHDPGDATSLRVPVPDYVADMGVRLSDRFRVGVPRQLAQIGIQPAVLQRFHQTLEAAGIHAVEVDLPTLDLAVACYYILAPAEASTNLARFDGVRYGCRAESTTLEELYTRSRGQGFGPEVKRRILVGTYVLSEGHVDAYYHQAQRVRITLAREVEDALDGLDAILTPTTLTPALRIGEAADPVATYLTDTLTIPASLTGHPALSVPMGQIDGLPIGCQIIGRRLDESTCFAVGAAVEAA
jgi:aspartyl-tRNA(Asn)/glutamyl-tRNA(Gln) amidotransferase subunit A